MASLTDSQRDLLGLICRKPGLNESGLRSHGCLLLSLNPLIRRNLITVEFRWPTGDVYVPTERGIRAIDS